MKKYYVLPLALAISSQVYALSENNNENNALNLDDKYNEQPAQHVDEAQEYDEEGNGLGPKGFSGKLFGLTGYSTSTSNDNTDDKTKNGPLNSKGESESGAQFGAGLELFYTFGAENTHQFLFNSNGSSMVEGVTAIDLGYSFGFGEQSIITMIYSPTLSKGEVWEDPYITDSPKKETDVSGNSYKISYDNMFNSGISSEFAYYDQDVEGEKSGQHLNSNTGLLNRDGSGYVIGLSTGFEVNDFSLIHTDVSYQKFDADGKAMAFDNYGFSVGYSTFIERHSFMVGGEYSTSQYDASHPIFAKKRKDNMYSVNAVYGYESFMDWDNVDVNVMVGYSGTASNITFYDSHEFSTGVGISYSF